MQNIFDFLTQLEANNNREWFKANDKLYRTAKSEFDNFVIKLILEINNIDNSVGIIEPKDCVFRIYRDVRFSKNKEPYKTHFGAYISKGGRKSKYAGYYIHIEKGGSFAGGGIYTPEPEILRKIRTEIYYAPEEIQSIINVKNFKSTFGEIYGEKLKTKPKGFDDIEHIDLIRHKHYAVVKSINDKDVLSKDFTNQLVDIFKIQKPFNDYLNSIVDE